MQIFLHWSSHSSLIFWPAEKQLMLTFKPDIYIYSRWDNFFISRPTDSHYLHLQADVSTSVIFFKVFLPTKLVKIFSEGGKKEEKRKGESRKQNGSSSKKSDPTNLKLFFIFKCKITDATHICLTSFFPLNKLVDNRQLWRGLPYPSPAGLCQEQTRRPHPEFLSFQFWKNSL